MSWQPIKCLYFYGSQSNAISPIPFQKRNRGARDNVIFFIGDFLNYRLPQTKQKRNPNAVSTSGSGPSPIKVTKLNTDARPLTADEYRKYGSLVNKLRHGK